MCQKRLTLGKLALLAGTLETELLAFFLAWVAAKQVGALERSAQAVIHKDECLRNADANCINLAGMTAAGNNS